jgi:hypothetical protein
MAVPKVIGTEIEYGVIVPNDPNFDPISVALLLVNSYHGDPQRRLLWDYDQEEPFMDARGFAVDAEFEPPDDQSNMSINTTLTDGVLSSRTARARRRIRSWPTLLPPWMAARSRPARRAAASGSRSTTACWRSRRDWVLEQSSRTR